MRTILLSLLLACSAHSAERPLVAFDFETDLANAGTLGGSARFRAFAPSEGPFFGFGPFGRCLDLTAASRHGGAAPEDPPAGGAAIYHDSALDALDTFTIMMWARQNPLAPGNAPARLLHKPGALVSALFAP